MDYPAWFLLPGVCSLAWLPWNPIGQAPFRMGHQGPSYTCSVKCEDGNSIANCSQVGAWQAQLGFNSAWTETG